MGTGCKAVLIIGGILGGILVVALVLSYVYCDKISSALIEKSVDALQAEVNKNLPEGYNADDIKDTFNKFKEALKSGALKDKIKSVKIQQFTQDVQEALKDKKIDKDELDKMLKQMKEIIGD